MTRRLHLQHINELYSFPKSEECVKFGKVEEKPINKIKKKKMSDFLKPRNRQTQLKYS